MKKEEKNLIIVFISSFVLISLIGYLMDIDILKFNIIRENGYTIHFVSLYISLFVSLIYFVIVKLLNKFNKNKKIRS